MKKKKKVEIGPVFTIMIISLILMVVSFVFSIFGISGLKTSIVSGTLETSVVTVKNIFTGEGLKFLLRDSLNNFLLFEPLALTILALIGIGIGEKSGLFKALFINLKNVQPRTITFFTVLFSIILNIFGNGVFVITIPIAGIVYKYAGRNSRLGVLTAFIASATGFASGFIFNNLDVVLGTLTQTAASLEVDKGYVYALNSNIFIMLGSAVILSLLASIVIDVSLAKQFPKKTPLQDEEMNYSKSGLKTSLIVALVMLLVFIYMIVPSLPFSGILLDNEATNYLEQLMGPNSMFQEGSIYLFTLLLMVCSLVYGYISGNVKSSNDYSVGLSKGFEGIGYLFVLLFFTSQMIAILNWTNLDTVISCLVIEIFNHLELAGILLIILFFILVIIVGLLIPSTTYKWELLSPTVVPMFMKANITPNFTQFIFRAADGISKTITPVFPYFVVLISFLQKYNYDEERKITIFGTIKLITPTIILISIIWLLILIGWYIINLPMGPNVFTTLN
jgi:aminobenzoyl-glutamate transport protein